MSCSVDTNRLRPSRTWIRRGSLSLNGASMTGSAGVASLMIGWQSMWDWPCRTQALSALSLQQTQARSSKLRVAARQQRRESQAPRFCSEKQKNPGRGSRPAGASKRFEGSGVEAAGQRNRIPFCSVIELCNLRSVKTTNPKHRIGYPRIAWALLPPRTLALGIRSPSRCLEPPPAQASIQMQTRAVDPCDGPALANGRRLA